jgi:hypothetical protein
MKSPMWILQKLLLDASSWCAASTQRDFQEIELRVKHEGESFLTITLPRFASDFESALERGYIRSTDFLGFKRRRGRPLPLFLGGLVSRVFNDETGYLLDNPCLDAIFYVRQTCLLLKKTLRPCSDVRNRRAFRKYVETESSIQTWREIVDKTLLAKFRMLSGALYSSRLSGVSLAISEYRHVPRHGPGATAERRKANERYAIREWHARLEDYFPSADFCIPSQGWQDSLEEVVYAAESAERPVRVIGVPKTQKTPRIIAIEPTCMQYTQQSILELLVPALEAPCFRGALGFSDQEPNRTLALLGSKDGTYATIDLSDASDRVHNDLVKLMLSSLPDLSDAVQACRSLRADVPGQGIIPLAKFASMGSALCFPIEAMTFLVIVLMALLESDGYVVNERDNAPFRRIDRALATVRIYGDDIIVPTDKADVVMAYLEAFGLKVNQQKSFQTGKFRESCGIDCYAGVDVTAAYLRKEIPSSLRDSLGVVSLMTLRNSFYSRGCWITVEALDDFLERIYPFPTVLPTSPLIGRFSFLDHSNGNKRKWNEKLHRYEVKGPMLKEVKRRDPLDGLGALMKFFLKRGSDPFQDVKHLEQAGRPLSVNIVTRWATPY